MQTRDNILELLREKGAEAARKAQRGLILQPGAIGDCILTLPLAQFMKQALNLGSVDLLGHAEYVGIFPGRSCIDAISSIDAVQLHRLFVDPEQFDLEDRDPLLHAFAGYAWIVTFLGRPEGHFEKNLIFTANCTHSAEVVTLAMKPPRTYKSHVTEFHKQQLASQIALAITEQTQLPTQRLLVPRRADKVMGRQILDEAGLTPDRKLAAIHPGSGSLKKCWHLDNFLAVAAELSAAGFDIVFLLGPAELERFPKSALRRIAWTAVTFSNLSLAQVLAILSCAEIYLGNDSGITHLAGALGVKTFAIFGPTDPAVYSPLGPSVTTIKTTSRNFATKASPRIQHRLLSRILR